MKFTNEQHEQIGFEVHRFAQLAGTERMIASGRAAVAAVAPLLLAELQHASDVEWSSLATYYQVKGLFLISFADLNIFLRNRLASVTAKPDPAVEAVEALMVKWPYGPETGGTLALEIVAAVDAARAK